MVLVSLLVRKAKDTLWTQAADPDLSWWADGPIGAGRHRAWRALVFRPPFALYRELAFVGLVESGPGLPRMSSVNLTSSPNIVYGLTIETWEPP